MDVRDLTIQQAREKCAEYGEMYAGRYDLMWSAFLAGMSRHEIAGRMGVSRQTVSDLIARRIAGG